MVLLFCGAEVAGLVASSAALASATPDGLTRTRSEEDRSWATAVGSCAAAVASHVVLAAKELRTLCTTLAHDGMTGTRLDTCNVSSRGLDICSILIS